MLTKRVLLGASQLRGVDEECNLGYGLGTRSVHKGKGGGKGTCKGKIKAEANATGWGGEVDELDDLCVQCYRKIPYLTKTVTARDSLGQGQGYASRSYYLQSKT